MSTELKFDGIDKLAAYPNETMTKVDLYCLKTKPSTKNFYNDKMLFYKSLHHVSFATYYLLIKTAVAAAFYNTCGAAWGHFKQEFHYIFCQNKLVL